MIVLNIIMASNILRVQKWISDAADAMANLTPEECAIIEREEKIARGNHLRFMYERSEAQADALVRLEHYRFTG